MIIDGFGVGVSIPGPGNVGDLVQGNFIGQYFVSQFDPITGAALPAPNTQIFTGIGNSLQGVLLGSTNATIGGFNPQENNVIAGNGLQGVEILPGAVGNQVLGNQIGIAGPSLGGRFAIAPNGLDGVLIASSGAGGGQWGLRLQQRHRRGDNGAGNLISANLGNGVHITGSGATLNQVEGNFIGTAPGGGVLFGQGDPGNSGDGVLIENAPNNIIGGSSQYSAERHLGQQGRWRADHGDLGHRQHRCEQYHRPELGWDCESWGTRGKASTSSRPATWSALGT